ncbi:hypothetical protein SNE40_019264 [Patella caerulea]|uniref:Uncharacterized protein n=1 Tax=Patella caerulea TaxID=87958 RepID=A0AAN8PF41_PATCE
MANVKECLLFIISLSSVLGQETVTFEVEQYTKIREPNFRNTVSEDYSVEFFKGEVLEIAFRTRKNVQLRVTNVKYTNDGGSDTVDLKLDDKILGSFVGHNRAGHGNLWGEVSSSGPIGSFQNIEAGSHTLQLSITEADQYGIELDVVELEVTGSLQGDMLRNEAYCDNRITYTPDHRLDNSLGYILQNIREPLCPKDKNINIPLHQKDAKAYIVTARRPKYTSTANAMESSFPGCKGESILWSINNFFGVPYADPINTPQATISFSGQPQSQITQMLVEFTISDANIPDSEMIEGGLLKLALVEDPSVKGGTFVKLFIKTGVNFVPFGNYHRANNSMDWQLPDLVMRKNVKNIIRIDLIADKTRAPRFEYLRFERTPTAPDTTSKIYEDTETTMTVSQIDQFWLAPHSMNVSIKGKVFSDQNVIKIFKNISTHTKKFEILNLRSDGELSINAIPPEGVDTIPFGSSVIIGKFTADQRRPMARIALITADPVEMKFYLTYEDKSTATMAVAVIGENTAVTMSELTFPQGRQDDPIAAVRSTWLDDGKNDVDHVNVDFKQPRAIVKSKWQKIYGTYFSFFRRCITNTNTQSSDLTIELLNGQQV